MQATTFIVCLNGAQQAALLEYVPGSHEFPGCRLHSHEGRMQLYAFTMCIVVPAYFLERIQKLDHTKPPERQ